MARYVRAAVREAQLLDAAKTVLVRDGYPALTLRAVAREAGVGLSTVQYVFHTRADLVQALIGKVTEDAGFRRPTLDAVGLRQALVELADWYGEAVLSDPGLRELLRADFAAGLAGPAQSSEDRRMDRPMFEHSAARIMRRLHDEDPDQWSASWQSLAAVCSSGFAGLTYVFLHTGDLAYYRESAGHLIDAIVALANPEPRSES